MQKEVMHYGTGEIATELTLAMQDGEHATVDHHVRNLTEVERDELRRLFLRLYWRLWSEMVQAGKPDDAVPFRSLPDDAAPDQL